MPDRRTPTLSFVQADLASLENRFTRLTRAGVVVTAAAMPLYLVRFKVGPIPTTFLEVSLLVTVGLYASSLIASRGPLPGRTGYEIPIALFLLAGAIGVFVAPDHRGALGIYRAYLLEPIALFYVALAVFEDSRRANVVLLPVAVATAVYCLVDAAFFVTAMLRGHLIPGHVAAAFSLNPNYVALYLEPLIGFAGGFLFFGSGRQRQVALGALVFMLPTEVATFSRGGLLSLALMALIVLATNRNPVLRAGIVAASLVSVVVIWNLPVLGARVRQLLSPTHGTLFNRERIWIATARMLRDHPIFGAGLNAYQRVMAPYRAGDPFQVPEPYPHNLALTSWTELGLLGLVAFAWILVGLLVRAWRTFGASDGVNRAILWGTGTAFAMIAVHGLVDSPYWKNDLSVEFWLLASLSVLAVRATRSAAPGAQAAPRP